MSYDRSRPQNGISYRQWPNRYRPIRRDQLNGRQLLVRQTELLHRPMDRKFHTMTTTGNDRTGKYWDQLQTNTVRLISNADIRARTSANKDDKPNSGATIE